MQENQAVTVLDLIRHGLRDPAKKKAFVDAQRERWGWTSSYRAAHARVDHWLEDWHPHRFPIEALEDAVRIIGDASFLDPLLAIEAKLLRQRRREAHNVEASAERRVA